MIQLLGRVSCVLLEVVSSKPIKKSAARLLKGSIEGEELEFWIFCVLVKLNLDLVHELTKSSEYDAMQTDLLVQSAVDESTLDNLFF